MTERQKHAMTAVAGLALFYAALIGHTRAVDRDYAADVARRVRGVQKVPGIDGLTRRKRRRR